MFVGETLKVCRHRHQKGVAIHPDWFHLLANDTMRPNTEANRTWVRWYGAELGLDSVEKIIEAVISQTWTDKHGRLRKGPRNYTAQERAQILSMTYAERQLLGLRRTGSMDVDKEGRERARRDRYNAKRRPKREAERRIRMSRVPVGAQGGVNRCKQSFKEGIGTRVDSESQENHRWINARTLESTSGRSKVPKIDPQKPVAPPPPCPESVPFAERVDSITAGTSNDSLTMTVLQSQG